MSLTSAQVRAAKKRSQRRPRAQPHAISARYDAEEGWIVVRLSNALDLGVPVDMAQGLAGAEAVDLSEIEISPTGLGLHWPRLDADLYLPALMEGVFGSRRWMAQVMGRAGERRARGPSGLPRARMASAEDGRAKRRQRETGRE
jgi:Protein of unknown function (DUF2442)